MVGYPFPVWGRYVGLDGGGCVGVWVCGFVGLGGVGEWVGEWVEWVG